MNAAREGRARRREPPILAFSGPSGVGETTLLEELLAFRPGALGPEEPLFALAGWWRRGDDPAIGWALLFVAAGRQEPFDERGDRAWRHRLERGSRCQPAAEQRLGARIGERGASDRDLLRKAVAQKMRLWRSPAYFTTFTRKEELPP